MENDQEPSRGFKSRIVFACVKLLAVVALLSTIYIGAITIFDRGNDYAQLAHDWIIGQITRIEVVREVVEVRPRSRSIDDVIAEASRKHGIPALLLKALILQESGRNQRTDRVRYEPQLQKRFKREAWMTDAEYQALASSWGLGQIIYGLWRDFCGLESYADLLEPSTNINCSAKIIRDCLTRRKSVNNKAERFRQCLREYNGGDTYSAQVERHLVELVLSDTI